MTQEYFTLKERATAMITIAPTNTPSQNFGQTDPKELASALEDKYQRGNSAIIDASEAKELLLKYFDPNSDRYIFKQR